MWYAQVLSNFEVSELITVNNFKYPSPKKSQFPQSSKLSEYLK